MMTTLPIQQRCVILRRRASGLISVVLIALTSLVACASSGSAHQNFRNIMSAKVGTSADSPSALAARNPDTREGVRALPNGSVEEGYRLNRTCRYYFEIDKSRKIVGWRYEGTEQECVVVP